jgi:tetratricopeptide (TPR) repeat protein
MDTKGRGFRRLFSSLHPAFSSILQSRPSPDLRELIREGDSLLEEGRLDPALKLYRKAARIDSGNSAENKSALVFGMMGRYMEAIVSLDRAIEIDPFDHQVWMHRGFLFWRLERWREALASFERARTLDPQDGYARYCWMETAEEMKRRRCRREGRRTGGRK